MSSIGILVSRCSEITTFFKIGGKASRGNDVFIFCISWALLPDSSSEARRSTGLGVCWLDEFITISYFVAHYELVDRNIKGITVKANISLVDLSLKINHYTLS